MFVELGTHLGESYFAFCQAILEGGTRCEATAVDTWAGDAHTGAYGEEVFREVDAHNREHYGSFSRLLRMSFDDAAAWFENESIDLLHIDGMHTYEAVRHDFDIWWPKVRPGGMVLLHDSFVRHSDFGVWKILEELRSSAPVSEFVHSNGLGLVQKPGGAPREGLVEVLFGGDEARVEQVRRYYEVCADHLEYRCWLERQKRPADWEITTKIYWRGEGEDFSEGRSIRLSHTIGSEQSRIALTVPRLAAPPVELRLDLSDVPACIALDGLSAVNDGGDVVWTMKAAENFEQLTSLGLRGVPATDGGGILVLDPPEGASFAVTVPEDAAAALRAGGRILVELHGLELFSYASQIAAALNQRRAEEVGELSAAHETASRLSLERFDEVQRYSAAFQQAERLALERLEELQRYDESLGNVQQRVSELEQALEAREHRLVAMRSEIQQARTEVEEQASEITETRKSLSSAQQRLEALEVDAQNLRAQLASREKRLEQIEGSRLWRAVKPLSRIHDEDQT